MQFAPYRFLFLVALVGGLILVGFAAVWIVIAVIRGSSQGQTLSALAEENRRLREEIDRLKRGET